jgi:hypothetical protein
MRPSEALLPFPVAHFFSFFVAPPFSLGIERATFRIHAPRLLFAPSLGSPYRSLRLEAPCFYWAFPAVGRHAFRLVWILSALLLLLSFLNLLSLYHPNYSASML